MFDFFEDLPSVHKFFWASVFLFILLSLAFDRRVRALFFYLIKKIAKSIAGFFVVLKKPIVIEVKTESLSNEPYKKDYKKDYTK